MKKLLAALMIAGLAQTAAASGIHIHDAWARPTVKGMNMGGAFMAVHNDNAKADTLIGGSSPLADRVEIHTHINDNGVMRMREVKDGVLLPQKTETVLKPGSYHIMFMGLKRQLKEGDKFPLTLKFKNAKEQTVEVQVKNMPAAMPHNHNHGDMHKH